MEFVLQRKNPAENLVGFVLVVALHGAIVITFMHGLVRHPISSTTPAPIDWVSVIDPLPPKHKAQTPEPLSRQVLQAVTSRQLVVDIPPVVVDTISVAANDSVAAPVAGQSQGIQTGIENAAPSAGLGAACPNAQGIRSTLRYPAQARRDGLQGEVLARFIVGANGEIRDVNIVSSSNRAFNGAVLSAVMQFHCVAQGRAVSVEVPFSFRLE